MTKPTIKAHGKDWPEIAAQPEFRHLVRAKLRLIVPATLFFIVYYFALPILVGYAPELMARKVVGNVNIAYLFALSQFFVAWGIAALYLRAASRFDSMARKIVERVGKQ
jgi:uncharacterized membrane protein (DUF485 family)